MDGAGLRASERGALTVRHRRDELVKSFRSQRGVQALAATARLPNRILHDRVYCLPDFFPAISHAHNIWQFG